MVHYLAGPMSGRPKFNFPLFISAVETLREQGLTVISPAETDSKENQAIAMKSTKGDLKEFGDKGTTWGDFLSEDIKMIADTDIDAIILLPEWETSKGARMEVFVCMTLGYPVFFYQDNDTLKQLDYTRVIADLTAGLLS